METTVVKEQALEKQIGGCMAGFFNIFDRPQLLSPKRFALPKRLSSSSSSSSANQKEQSVYSTPELRSPENPPAMDFKQGSPWRFSKEAPRLSLDSRAVVDTKGSLRPRQIRAEEGSGSPSVIARLMGLEALPSAQPLQRCASESRVSRFVDLRDDDKSSSSCSSSSSGGEDPPAVLHIRSGRAQPARAPPARRVSGFDAPTTEETLKQLVEALRLKGLLHSSTNKAHRDLGFHNHQSLAFHNHRSLAFHNHQSVAFHNRPIKPPPPSSGRRRDRSEGISTSVVMNPTNSNSTRQQRRVRQGTTLLERCDKLLYSIAQMAAAEAGESQPSPVSVLDASPYNEESSPSPVMKRCLDFTESEDESWASLSSSSDSEYAYISDILRASDCLPRESDIFSLLERQQKYLKGRAAAQERRLIFDAVQEIVGKRRRLPPWRMVGEADKTQVIWSEFQKMRNKRPTSEEEDLVGYVCGVLRRDLSEDRWRDCQAEMSEAVLDIERLVFKDLIGETIRHMAALNRSDSLRLRRRLLF